MPTSKTPKSDNHNKSSHTKNSTTNKTVPKSSNLKSNVKPVPKVARPKLDKKHDFEYDDNEIYDEEQLFKTTQLDSSIVRKAEAYARFQRGAVTALVSIVIFACISFLVYLFINHNRNNQNALSNIPAPTTTVDTFNPEQGVIDYNSPLDVPNLAVTRALWSNGSLAPTYEKPSTIDPSIPIFIIMHGYGGNEVSTSSMWASFLHGKQWVSVRAPFDLNNDTKTYSGFSWMEPPVPKEPSKQLVKDANVFQAWVDANLDPSQQIILIGHSQGGAMVSQMMRTNPTRYNIGISVAGFISEKPVSNDDKLSKDQYLFSAYSTNDAVVSHDHEIELEKFFKDKVSYISYDYPDRSHASLNDPEVETDVQNWLVNVLPNVLTKHSGE